MSLVLMSVFGASISGQGGRASEGHSHQHCHSSPMLGQFLPWYIISADWKLQYIMVSKIREEISQWFVEVLVFPPKQ